MRIALYAGADSQTLHTWRFWRARSSSGALKVCVNVYRVRNVASFIGPAAVAATDSIRMYSEVGQRVRHPGQERCAGQVGCAGAYLSLRNVPHTLQESLMLGLLRSGTGHTVASFANLIAGANRTITRHHIPSRHATNSVINADAACCCAVMMYLANFT